MGFESFILPRDEVVTSMQVYEVVCRAIVFPMAMRNPGRPKKIVDGLNLLPQEEMQDLGIVVGSDDGNVAWLEDYSCHECGKRLLKVQRCSACKAVNYCSRECMWIH